MRAHTLQGERTLINGTKLPEKEKKKSKEKRKRRCEDTETD